MHGPSGLEACRFGQNGRLPEDRSLAEVPPALKVRGFGFAENENRAALPEL
jgi:hypothetical protein